MDLGRLYREESGRILATTIRLLGDMDLAEEVVQEAFAAALAQWPTEGVPEVPVAWVTSVNCPGAAWRMSWLGPRRQR